MLPPPIKTTLSKRMIVRWTTTQALGSQTSLSTVTFVNIGDIVGIAVSATVGYQLFNDCVRVRRVSIWGSPSATGTATTCAVDFSGTTTGAVGESQRYVDTAIGLTTGPIVHARPSKLSQAGMWQRTTAGATAFTFQCTGGSIVELEFDGVNSEGAVGNPVQAAIVGGTVGATFMRDIQGQAFAGATTLVQGFYQL